jgi:hypothetical protein
MELAVFWISSRKFASQDVQIGCSGRISPMANSIHFYASNDLVLVALAVLYITTYSKPWIGSVMKFGQFVGVAH